MNELQIRQRIDYWTRRRCPKQAAAWREILRRREAAQRPAPVAVIPSQLAPAASNVILSRHFCR